jgi:hypothetical protein
MKPFHYIIEGIDRIGKGTVISEIKRQQGFKFTQHFVKPEILNCYAGADDPLKMYQNESFYEGFSLLAQCEIPFIFDRFHLGEIVYSPRYRNYSGNYVYDIERNYEVNGWGHVKLILLTTSDFSILTDDGESFDFTRKEEEQNAFIEAINNSLFLNKQVIDVISNNIRKTPFEIYTEIVNEN